MNPSTSTTVNQPASTVLSGTTLPSSPKIPQNITIRPARETDLEAMSTCFFTSFNPSHPFWHHEFGPEKFYTWWVDAWRIGLLEDPTMITIVAVDTAVKPDMSPQNKALQPWEQKGANVSDGRLVAFTRWRVPQADGNLEQKWPELPGELDMEVMDGFFGGMAMNHEELMGNRPHWFLQMLGTETGYQKQGIGRCFVEWGCRLADEQGIECYVDASDLGAPVYRSAGFVRKKRIAVPDRERYGHIDYESYVRPKKG